MNNDRQQPNRDSNPFSYFRNFRISDHPTGIGFILLFILAVIVGWPTFLQLRNLTNILRQISYTGIIALGMTMIIISGGIDLSVGSMTAFVGGLTIFFLNLFPSDSVSALILASIFAMAAGAASGLFNGILVTKGRIAPFIATLGTMSIFRSLIQYFSGAGNILSNNILYADIGSGVFLGIPVPVWVFLIVAVILHIVLENTRFGRYVCAVGANEQVARYSAIRIQIIKMIPYVITGFTAGLTALLWSSRLNCINPSDCSGYELDAIAAAVIGGTSMNGGKGSIIGTVMGAVMLGIINNMLVLGGVSSYLQQAARGLVIIVAVLLQYNNKN
ncbi:MAG: ABC transporter permease [Sphaerochaetaceae bacterium]|nr:ABC transporter permease [Sphaerochaetaceae bacterium]